MSDQSDDHPFSEVAWRIKEAELRRSLEAEGKAIAIIDDELRQEWERWQIIQDRYNNVARMKAQRDPLWVAVFTILTRHDLVGIAFPEVPDEYELEANSVTSRLADAHSVHDVREILRQVFLQMFNVDVSKYAADLDAMTRDMWDALCQHRRSVQP